MKQTVREKKTKAASGSQCACFNLRKAARAVTQYYDETMRQSGVHVTQMSVLVVLNQLGEATMNQLAEATVTDRTTLTRNLKILEKQGFIAAHPGQDRRERLISMTAKGRKVLKKGFGLWRDVQGKLVKKIGAKRFESLIHDLNLVVEATRK